GGYNEELNEEFLQGISRLTYQTQRRVNYIFFLNVSNLNKRSFQNRVIKNLIMSHIIPILPLNYDNSKDVLYNNEEKYGVEIKNNDVKEKIISLSGGHPGLLKAIYLQAKDIAGWSEPDYGDIQLSTRSMDILNELDGEKKEILVNPKLNKNDPAKSELYGFLTFYGYLNQNGEVFSPILTEYLKREYNKDVSTSIMQENILISLTKQQREAMQMFFENRGRIVRREELAEFLWGDTAHEDYSDWALDQFIHTLRNKIKSISGLGKIVTKKGEGYLYKK
ncbi:MAG TPA: helix-turn-helix domain-containing protein, partial [Patescibacteria group bacterium]|nr:helix-turn-helix domain-containing protein [Patescibacteria group bacterium]